MYQITYSNKSKADLKRLIKNSHFRIEEFKMVLKTLSSSGNLDIRHRNHKLNGEFVGCWECHVQPNVLLIYSIDKDNLVISLLRIGSHPDLF